LSNLDRLISKGKESSLRLPERLLVAASPESIGYLSAEGSLVGIEGAALLAIGSESALPGDAIDNASLVVLEVDPSNPASLRRLSLLRSAKPDLPVIAALADANVALVRTLVRQGVVDVVSLPFNPEELLQVCLSVATDAQKAATTETHLAPLVAIVRGVGGSGATTIATHLASALGARSTGGCGACLIDLDIQFGSVAGYLNVAARRTLADLLDAEGRIDADLLRSVVVQHHSGIDIIAAPEMLMPLEDVDAEQLLRIIEIARQEYDFVLIDLPSNWTHWNLSVAISANIVLMVVELGIASLRQAKRRLELFISLGLPHHSIGIVANRVEKRLFKTIGTADVERALGHEVVGTIHAEPAAISSAQDQGLLVDQVVRKSRFGTDIGDLADWICQRLELRGLR
jgi:pilus assembly protein CpaE